MRRIFTLLLIFVCLFSAEREISGQRKLTRNIAPIQNSAANNSNVLPIHRVILYSNGMVYIERRGLVSGNTEINLSFKQSQVDDVLKSMVVLDLGQGKIGAVSYNSSVPAAARTAEIPFNINSQTGEDDSEEPGGLAAILTQLQGAKVLVTSNKGAATGAILSVEKKQIFKKSKDSDNDESKTFMNAYSLVIAGENGEISNFELSDVRSVKLLDEETKRDVNEFASATASARRRDAKTINITSNGNGQREMIVSYTVSAPIWKTTYRVILDNDGKPFFQGWAIVDNVSDEDWKNVNLSLVSGSPISFIQPIQNPLYRYRPVIEIPEDLNLEPQIYDPTAGRGGSYGYGSGDGSGTGNGSGNGMGGEPPPMIANDASVQTSVSELLASENSGVQTAAKGAQFGDLFEYKIEQPVTVFRNRSALIPIVQTKMEGERVSIYNESVKIDRPMSGLLLDNTSDLTLEDGSMTVFDRDAYAGEALMQRLKPKEKRLISFAMDLGTLVTVKNEAVREPAKIVKAVNGSLQIHYFQSTKKIYTFTNQTDQTKTIFIEHPVKDKWILSAETQKPFDVTQNNYRFRQELQPFETKIFNIAEQQPLMDSYKIALLTFADLDMFVSKKYINQDTRQKLNRLIDLRSQIAETDRKLAALEEEETSISEDQSRLRENIEALTKTPEAKQLISRYISKADEQESRIEAINKEKQNLKTEKSRLEQELAKAITNFEL